MIRPRVKLELYKKISKTEWQDTPIDISDFVDVQETEGIETRKDTMKFTIPSRKYKSGDLYIFSAHNKYSNGGDEPIAVGDRIMFYAWNGPTPSVLSDYLIMEAIITANDYKRTDKGLSFQFTGANRTEIMLDTLVPALISESGSSGRVDLAIKELFRIALIYNQNLPIKVIVNPDGSKAIDDTYIVNVRSDDSSFDPITYVDSYKTLFQHLEILSGTKYTGDTDVGNYMYYVDRDQYLHWGPRPFTVGATLDEFNFMESSLSKNTTEIINAIIVHGGNDMYGNGVLKVAYNLESMAKVGSKWKYHPATNLADAIKKLDKDGALANNGVAVQDNGWPPNYTMNGGLGWLMNFTVRDEAGTSLGNNYVTSDDEYNEAIRSQISFDAKGLGDNIINVFKNPRYAGTLTLPYGSTAYAIGTLYKIRSTARRWVGTNIKKLRCVNLQHRFTASGWITSLQLKEDEHTANIDSNQG